MELRSGEFGGQVPVPVQLMYIVLLKVITAIEEDMLCVGGPTLQ